MSEIYNKNAREAHLMAEAYTNIYTEAHESKDRIHSSEDAEMQFDSRGFAINTPAGREVKEDIKVGNIYKGESYHELVVGVKGDEVFTKKITLEDGNRYDANKMLDEVKLAGKLNIDFLNEVL